MDSEIELLAAPEPHVLVAGIPFRGQVGDVVRLTSAEREYTLTRPMTMLLHADGSVECRNDAMPSIKQGHAVLAQADRMFRVASALLPTRLANEEFGDAIEDIRNRVYRGDPGWAISCKMWSAIVWTLFHAIKYGWRQVAARQSGGGST